MEFDLSKKHCYYFNEISKIPRGSGNEKAISDYIVKLAEEKGYHYLQDGLYNVIVNKPASQGYEDAETVILQAHMDMVCEKNSDTEHDFTKDPLDLYVDEEGWLHAKGTTLGADDGQGVAYMLAILDDPNLKHPPLQCCFTVMEEIGLLGAIALKKEYFHARRYINLDSGGETLTCVSSSGGARITLKKSLTYETNDKAAYCLQISGLKGGHSAGCIHLERGNAILLGARIMKQLQDHFPDLCLSDLHGGMKFNAIPREASFSFCCNADKDQLQGIIDNCAKEIGEELQYSDAGFTVSFSETTQTEAIDYEQSHQIIDFLNIIPNGLQHHSMAIEGLSVASLNAGVLHIEDKTLYLDDLIRSALASHGDQMIRQFEILCPLFAFTYTINDRYYGWDYSKDSKLREILAQVLLEKGFHLQEKATHGGLECGIFKNLLPDLDIITYGPVSYGEHTPDEKLDLASFDRAYANLLEVLERCR